MHGAGFLAGAVRFSPQVYNKSMTCMQSSSYAVVVGGANIDIGARSLGPLVPKDSNPGIVTSVPGGVARNIAHNLALLGVPVVLLTALGDDSEGAFLQDACIHSGIDMRHVLQSSNHRTSVYLYVADAAGEMQLAVSDMSICEEITPAYLAAQQAILDNAALVCADTNLTPAALKYLAEHCTQPLFVDPVSTNKAEKLHPLLSKIHTLKPNRLEAAALTGVEVTNAKSAAFAAQKLLAAGVRQVFLSLGEDGLLAASQEGVEELASDSRHIVSTTGCGDAFMAALLYAHIHGYSLEDTARLARAAARLVMESVHNIAPHLSEALLLQTAFPEKMPFSTQTANHTEKGENP